MTTYKVSYRVCSVDLSDPAAGCVPDVIMALTSNFASAVAEMNAAHLAYVHNDQVRETEPGYFDAVVSEPVLTRL